MNKWMKILLGTVAALVVVLMLALGALALFFDPNDYKPQINAAIEQEIGRQVAIDGPIKLSVFPWLGLELGHATVANADGFGSKPLAEVAGASASIRLLPLLRRDIRVGTVTLNGLRLRLTRHPDGQSNWQGILDQIASSEQSQDAVEDTPSPAADGTPEVAALEVGAIEITDAAVDWDDQQAKSHYRISGFELDTGRLTDGDAFRMEFGGDLGLPDQNLHASFNVVSSIEPHLADRFYRFPRFSLNVLIKGPSLPGGEQEANMSAAGEMDLTAGRFSLDNVTLQSSGATVTGKMAGNGLNDKLVYNGRLTIQPLSPRSVMQQMQITPPKTQDKAALGSASFDAQFEGDAGRIRFKQIKATLDDSTLAGTGRIDSSRAPNKAPHIVFDLNLDQLNVDNYLPPGSAEQAKTSQPPQTGGGAAQKDAEFDLSALKGLHLDAKLHIGALTAGNIKVSNARVDLAANNGQLDIDPLSAQLYGGRVDMKARVDARKDTPRFDLSGRMDNLQVQPLLQDVAASDRLSARGDLRLNLKAEGKQVAELKRSLSGRASFDLADGAIHGVSLEALLDAARRKMLAGRSQGDSAISPAQKTVFSTFGGHFTIRDGLMSGDDLTLVTPRLTGHGAGSYDLPSNKLDYTLTAQVPKDEDGRLKELAGAGVPVRLTGELLSPSYSLDLASALKSAAGNQLKSRGTELRDKLKEKTGDGDLGSKVQQGISDLFGGDKSRDP